MLWEGAVGEIRGGERIVRGAFEGRTPLRIASPSSCRRAVSMKDFCADKDA